MYQYTAPSTVLLALRQRFRVGGSIRVKGPRMGTRFPTLPYPYSEYAYRSSESVRNNSSPVSCRGTRKGSQDRNDNGYLRWTPLLLTSRRPCCCWRPKVTPQLLLGSS